MHVYIIGISGVFLLFVLNHFSMGDQEEGQPMLSPRLARIVLDSGSISKPMGCNQAYHFGLIVKGAGLGPIYS